MDKNKEWALIQGMMTGDYNENHDPDTGRFASGSGGSASPQQKNLRKRTIISKEDREDGSVHLKYYDKNGEEAEQDFPSSQKFRQFQHAENIFETYKGNVKANKTGLTNKTVKHPYMKKAVKAPGTRAVLEQMDGESQDNVLKAVAGAVASPGPKKTKLTFGKHGEKSITVSPSRDASGPSINWTDRRGIPNASHHHTAEDLALHTVIQLKDMGYSGEKIKMTRDAASDWNTIEHMMVGDFNPNHDPDDGRFTSGSGSTGGGSGERLGMTALREAKIGTRVITGTGKIYEKTDDKDLPWHNIEDRHGDKASSTYLAQSREPGGVTLYKGSSASGGKMKDPAGHGSGGAALSFKSPYNGKTGRVKYRDLEFDIDENGNVTSGPKALIEGLKHPKAPGEGLKQGELVVYAPKWRSPGEEKYIHVILEERGPKYLIGTLNTNLSLGSTESVSGEMIQSVGYNAGVNKNWEKYNDPN